MSTLLHALRYPARRLTHSLGFTLTVVLTFALGIGATTAIFSLVEGILLRPLPFSHPDRLVLLGDRLGSSASTSVMASEIGTYSRATAAFSSLGGFAAARFELSGGDLPETVSAARLTASVFPTLGVRPLLGRVFTRNEEDARQPLAVISYSLWQNRYHRDPRVLGASLILDRKPYSIIGVMPRDFEFPLVTGHLDQARLWVPMSLTPEELLEQGAWRYNMVARIKPGVTLRQAAQDTDRVARQTMRGFPAAMSAIHIQGDLTPLHESVVADARPALRALFAAVSVVLLIACANVAGLLLVRALRRRRDYAVRLALGASAAGILRESIGEGLLLSVSGGLLGLALATGVIHTTLRLLPEAMPRVEAISVNATVAAFSLLLAVTTGVVCGAIPAFVALRTNLTETLKEGSPIATRAAGHNWVRSALVVFEIAIALTLLTVSGAFLRSFAKMRAVDPGFRADHVLVAGYQLPLQHYPSGASAGLFDHAVLHALSGKPGILAAGFTSALPATGFSGMATYTVEGQRTQGWKVKFAQFATLDGSYFQAMGIPLLDGRSFTEDDGAGKPPVMIVNQSMARHCWPGQRAVGKRLHAGNPHKGLPWATVVGVVADTRLGSRDEPSNDQWYTPMQQPATLGNSGPAEKLTDPAGGYLVLRSALPPAQMVQSLRSAVREVDPLLALEQVQPMETVLSNVEAPRRFNTGLITAFAASALLLALTGIYAVVAFSVSLRTQEIAIRMALGAERKGIARLVLLSGAKMAMLGCGLGILGSVLVAQLVRSFLFEVSATDPIIYIASVLIMISLALLASALPAARAASTDPIKALRSV